MGRARYFESGVSVMRRNDREITGRQGIEEILCGCRTCRIAMIDEGRPYIVPMSFGYKYLDDGALELYFHSAKEGKKIEVLKADSKVCFEISNEGEAISAESPCSLGYYYFSIIGFGEASFIDDVEEKCAALSSIVKHQAGRDMEITGAQAESVCVFKIASSEYTGKRKQKPMGAL